MSDLISLYGATKVNGYYVANNPNSFLNDCNPAYINWVMNVNLTDQTGNSVAGFWIKYQEPQKVIATDIFMKTHPSLTTLADFASGLAAVSASNTFTNYTNLIKSSDKGSYPTGTGLLVNDKLTDFRQYLPNVSQTKVNVNVKNRVLATSFFFTGDQTNAGLYQYFTSAGNV